MYKTIAVYLARPETVPNVMAVAVPLAESFDAHLMGVHVMARGMPIAGTIGGQLPPDVVEQYMEFLREDAKAIEAAFAKAVKGASVASEWRGADAAEAGVDILHAITAQIRCSDLVVTGQDSSEQRVGELMADVILATGRPVLIVPNEGTFDTVPRRIVIGWDGSREAARAAFDALPLLKTAGDVSIATATRSGKEADSAHASGAELALALVRHGIKAETVTLDKGHGGAGKALVSYCSERDSDLLVMGCYGHSRIRERLFGGATLHLFNNMIVPVLMSH